jgi:hypothetical protein
MQLVDDLGDGAPTYLVQFHLAADDPILTMDFTNGTDENLSMQSVLSLTTNSPFASMLINVSFLPPFRLKAN